MDSFCQIRERRAGVHKSNHYKLLKCAILIFPAVIWQYKSQSERSAMRIASSPTLRIAAGLLLAVLLSVVGYQVFRRLNSHGPEALLKRADGSLWPDIEVQTSPYYIYEELGFNLLPAALRKTPTSRPLHIAIGSSVPFASHDPIADLRLPPDLVWHQFNLSRRPIRSQYRTQLKTADTRSHEELVY